ncbi:MAG: flippase-like domain-containing protein, partial [Ignavibacteriaceae bacterium]|nr:flippase-like domain-containing protein [Ignavibacteriaceae bacterium]
SNIHHAYESSYTMLRPIPLFYMTLLSLVSWFFECLGYYIILINFHIDVTIFWSSFSYALATIVGAITMLPGGLGVTEGSLTLLLVEKGVANEIAVASTFIIRVVTLWFAVLVGVISVTLYQKRFGKITVETIVVDNSSDISVL